ncbi:hypothetical protein ILUMI_09405, partial [Ignelater luminosus]
TGPDICGSTLPISHAIQGIQEPNVDHKDVHYSYAQKARYATEEDMPPPPSPPQIREAVTLDGVPRQGSLERGLHRKISLDRDQANRDTPKQ